MSYREDQHLRAGCTEDHDHEAELARLMAIPGALEAYHGWMHGFHGFPFEGCDMTGLGPHEGPDFEAGMERGRERRAIGEAAISEEKS